MEMYKLYIRKMDNTVKDFSKNGLKGNMCD